jgi:hypothetical protein
VEVSYVAERAEDAHIRIDLRSININYLDAVCRIARDSDCYFLTEDLMLIKPERERLLKEIEQSNAFRFVTDPRAFFDNLRGLPQYY